MNSKAEAANRGRRGRDALLQACIDQFATPGIRDASLRQIADAVGSSHRMLHVTRRRAQPST